MPTSPEAADPWDPLPLSATCALFAAADVPWWVSGGHALDLFVGRTTRAHADTDISVFRQDAGRVRRLLGNWDLFLAHAGTLTPWLTDEVAPPYNSLWCRPSPPLPWRLQVMLDDGTPAAWECHRHADIRLPLDRAIAHTADGIAYLRPEIQLLLKAKDPRPKDDADFATVFPHLGPGPARWLTDALRRHYPRHRWLDGI